MKFFKGILKAAPEKQRRPPDPVDSQEMPELYSGMKV